MERQRQKREARAHFKQPHNVKWLETFFTIFLQI